MPEYRSYSLKRRNGRIITATYGSHDIPTSYPSDGMAALDGHKPAIHLATAPNTTLAILTANVYTSLMSAVAIDPKLANLFLHTYFASLEPQASQTAWSSFGVDICAANGRIRIPDLYEHFSDLGDITVPAATPLLQPLPTALLLLGAYRIISGNEKQRAGLIERLGELYRPFSEGHAYPPHLAMHAGTLSNDPNFKALSAASDMYNDYFKMAPLNVLRFGSVVSCWKDSAALMSVCFAEEHIFGRRSGIGHWILTSYLADEYERVTQEGEEMQFDHTYAAYAVDFGIVKKSPYSATVNRALHILINMVGTFLQNPRCCNARLLDCTGQTDVATNALFIAYAVDNSGNVERQFIQPEAAMTTFNNSTRRQPNEEEPANAEPLEADPEQWILWFERASYRPTQRMMEYARNKAVALDKMRKGSVGEYIKNKYSGLLSAV